MASLRNRSLLFRILQQARPCWLRLTGIAVLGLLSIPLALLFPLPLKIAVDSVLGHQPLPAFMSMSWVSPSSAGALVLAVGLLLAISRVQAAERLRCIRRVLRGEVDDASHAPLGNRILGRRGMAVLAGVAGAAVAPAA